MRLTTFNEKENTFSEIHEVGMPSRYDHAELLAALWKLGADKELLPTSHGILDRTLRECAEDLPSGFGEDLTFGITGVGLRCYELPDILLAAQEALLTSEPNPTYLSTIVQLDEEFARQIVLRRGISTTEARRIGARMKATVDRIRSEMAGEPAPRSATA